jgi:hypothetical protein
MESPLVCEDRKTCDIGSAQNTAPVTDAVEYNARTVEAAGPATGNMDAPPVGGEPTEEKFYLEWGLETFKNNVTRLNDLQKNLVTLSVSLLAGTLIFYNDTYSVPVFKILASITLLVGAIVSVLGSMPHESRVELRSPRQIKILKEKTFSIKKRWYYASICLIYGGLVFALLGFMMKWWLG